MRVCALLLGLCAACTTTVRDLQPGRVPDRVEALVGGQLDFDVLHLRKQPGGEEFDIRPEHREFLVAIPAGTYVVTGFGPFRPMHDRLTLDAIAGQATYVGGFARVRDDQGRLLVQVRDDLPATREVLARRYRDVVPELKPGVVTSSLEPIGKDFVVAVHKPRTYVYWGVGFYAYPYHHSYYYHRHHGHRHRRYR